MNLLDRLLGHDDWTTRQVLAACGILSPAQLQQPLALGHATIAGTVRHIVNNVAIWTDLMMERPLSAMAGWSDTEVATWYAVWERAYADFAICSTQMAHAGRLDESYIDTLDSPPTRKTFGGTIAHVITHNMHHRGELIRALG